MSSIKQVFNNPREASKWRTEANRAAVALKSCEDMPEMSKPEIKVGFVFNDAVVKVTIAPEKIKSMSASDLADFLYNEIAKAAT